MFDYVMNHVDLDSGLYAAHPEWFAREGDRFRLCGPENLWEDSYWEPVVPLPITFPV